MESATESTTEEKQQILLFITHTRDHSAVWEFWQYVPNPKEVPSHVVSNSMRDNTGQLWLCNRNIFNTKAQAKQYLSGFFEEQFHDYRKFVYYL